MTPELQQKMQALQAVYGAKLRAKVADMQQQCALCRAAPSERDHVDLLYRQLHSLAGSAGTFGFTAFGAAARKIEDGIRAALDGGSWAQQDYQRIGAALDELLQALPVEIASE